jgi:hypothetical protein
MSENLVPIIIMTGMFAMIFGIVYVRSRENMALIEKGLNPRIKAASPKPFVNLKYGLLLIGSGLGLLSAYIIDYNLICRGKPRAHSSITIGGHHSKGMDVVVATPDTSHGSKDTSIQAKTSTAQKEADDANTDDLEDQHRIAEIRGDGSESVPIYFALIAIGGGLGLFFSYRIEKKEWLDKRKME